MNPQISEITIDGKVYVPKGDAAVTNTDGLQAVLVRTVNAGVHFGYKKSEEHLPSGCVVELVNTRRVWYWSGACSLSQMAMEGVKNPNDCKFSIPVPINRIIGVIEILPLTAAAVANLYGVKEWKN